MPRNKDPAVLFYPSDFLSATVLWTDEEIGKYIKLLCLQFLQNGVSEDEIDAVCGENKRVRSKFHPCDDGLYRNPRMAEEAEKRRTFSESRRNNINKRYAKNPASEKDEGYICTTSVEHMKNICASSEVHMINENINENINIDKSIDKDTKVVRHKYGLYNNVLLSDEEITKLQAEFPSDWRVRIERLSEYIASTGKTYKSHLATIRSWHRMDKESKPPDKPRYGNFDPEEALEAAIRRSRGEA